MINRVFSIAFDGVNVAVASGDVDLFEVSPAANKPVVFLGLSLTVSSEVGDAAEQILRLTVNRLGATASSGNGTAVTPVPRASANAAAGAACEYVGASVATTTGTNSMVHADCFNVRSGYQLWWTPETAPVFVNGELGVVRLPVAVANDMTVSGTLYFAEI